ncbi:hypothetical protein HC823_00455 [Candidatus Gracilibacteria bacterium]|nr:hypothetical protein [Candidatus Gracilibacteria bacterium]
MTDQQLKIRFQQKLEKQKDAQLSFADYWEDRYNNKEGRTLSQELVHAFETSIFEDIDSEAPKQTTPFDFKLKNDEPLWKDTLAFGSVALCMWGATHVALNFSAFAEIASFKANQIKTSIYGSIGKRARGSCRTGKNGEKRNEGIGSRTTRLCPGNV